MQTILSIDADAKFTVYNENIDSIKWITKPIPKEDILAKQSELNSDLESEWIRTEYRRDRKSNYPEIGDQLDALFHAIDSDSDLKNKFSEFHSMIKDVKDKYPKHYINN